MAEEEDFCQEMFLTDWRDLVALGLGTLKADSLVTSKIQAEVEWLPEAVMLGQLRMLVMVERGVGACILRRGSRKSFYGPKKVKL